MAEVSSNAGKMAEPMKVIQISFRVPMIDARRMGVAANLVGYNTRQDWMADVLTQAARQVLMEQGLKEFATNDG